MKTEIKSNRVCYVRKTWTLPNGMEFRETAAYRVVGFDASDKDRDPCFIAEYGLTFCNMQEDTFSKVVGREYANAALVEYPQIVRIYAGQPVLVAIHRALSKMDHEQIENASVPSRLVPLIRALRKSKYIKRCPAERHESRQKDSQRSRFLFRKAQADGKTKEEAIVYVRDVMSRNE